MKKEKSTPPTEAQLLELLKRILPVATHDASLAGAIYTAAEDELKKRSRATAFQRFCNAVELPDLTPQTIASVNSQFVAAFGDGDVTLKFEENGESLTVEVQLPDGRNYSATIAVMPVATESEEKEIALKFVPFPVCLAGDPELIWTLAKRENLTNDEAGIVLTKVQDDFWGSKTGQKLLRDRVERSFPEFISRVPAGALNEVGLKRHYKLPEVLKTLVK